MSDRIYHSYPALYECFHTEYDFDREVAFILQRAAEIGIDHPDRILEIGCGTGQHSTRLATMTEMMVGVDLHRGMVAYAAEKGIDRLVQGAIPELPVCETFPIVGAIRAVINHLPPSQIEAGIRSLAARVASPGVLVFDNFHFPPDGAEVALDIGEINGNEVARIVTMNPGGPNRLNWDTVYFLPSGETIVNRRPVTIVDDDTIEAVLLDEGMDVNRVDGFHADDEGRTVFVATNGV